MLHNSDAYFSTGSDYFDEMFNRSGHDGARTRAPYQILSDWLEGQDPRQLQNEAKRAQDIFRSIAAAHTRAGGDERNRMPEKRDARMVAADI